MTEAAQTNHVLSNRAMWDVEAAKYVEPGHRAWGLEDPEWGIWHVPESALHILPADVAGLRAIELGCGTGYVSAWLARRGARPVGIDNSREQLRTCRRFQREFSLSFPIIHGNAETLPFPDAVFDLAISEYGAAIWCDPYRWIPEAARVLRPGGELIFYCNSTILMLCVPDEDDVPAGTAMIRPQFGMHRFEWPDDPGIEFHLSHGDWIRLFRANGLAVENLIEVRPQADAETRYPYVTLEWSRNWPCEEAWVLRKER